MLACESESVETVEALLRGGSSTQLVDQLGHKAADYAITTGNQCIVRMLQDGVPPGTKQGLLGVLCHSCSFEVHKFIVLNGFTRSPVKLIEPFICLT